MDLNSIFGGLSLYHPNEDATLDEANETHHVSNCDVNNHQTPQVNIELYVMENDNEHLVCWGILGDVILVDYVRFTNQVFLSQNMSCINFGWKSKTEMSESVVWWERWLTPEWAPQSFDLVHYAEAPTVSHAMFYLGGQFAGMFCGFLWESNMCCFNIVFKLMVFFQNNT